MAPHLGATVPGEIGMVEFHGRAGLVMSPVAGTPMLTLYARRGRTADRPRVAGDFAAAARWLADLQRATAVESAPLDMDRGVAARLGERFADDDRIDQDLERLAAIHSELARNTVPRAVVHGDFWFGNLMVSDDRVSGVVDWEAGEACGEPVRDVVRFALMYAMFLDRGTKPGRRVAGHRQLRAGTWGVGVDYALDGSGWFPELIRQFLRAGLARLGAAPECWRDAALAGVAEVAALADDPEFARSNLELFRRLASRGHCVPRPTRPEEMRP
jgi:aminoglycoside phosphotransferase